MATRRLLTSLLCLLLAALAKAPACAAGEPPVTPSGLYSHVFELISERFYDPTFNKQKWSRWQHRYDGKLKTMDDARRAIQTMLASLNDRYTRYLDPSAFDDEKQQIESKLCGVGMQLGLDKTQKLICIAPIDGTPAAKAGIMPNDQIVEIDGKSTNGLTVEQASKLIRGAIGSKVNLALLRGGKRLEFTITRDEIPIRSVHAIKMLTDDIGYIQLGTFMSERAGDEVREALDKLSPARGIIIDLRNNPGGLVTNAIDICSMFIDGSGVVVSTIDRSGKAVASRATGRTLSRQPLVVLINGGSASASEITSGALHDSQRAQLVGQKSFGKGLVQSITRLEDGSGVNVTIARYMTPNNIDIHKKGIEPDFPVELKSDDYTSGRGPWFIYPENLLGPPTLKDIKDTQLKEAVKILEQRMNIANAAEADKPIKLEMPKWQLPSGPFPNSMPADVTSN